MKKRAIYGTGTVLVMYGVLRVYNEYIIMILVLSTVFGGLYAGERGSDCDPPQHQPRGAADPERDDGFDAFVPFVQGCWLAS